MLHNLILKDNKSVPGQILLSQALMKMSASRSTALHINYITDNSGDSISSTDGLYFHPCHSFEPESLLLSLCRVV